ncbi:MAG: Hsp20/alpha crystallin family protein [Dehalococcoidia bacterium]|jgi:HSP20 family protein
MVFQRTSETGTMPDVTGRQGKPGKYPVTATRFPVYWRTPNDSLLWSPIIEMFSDKDKITLRVEVPGIKKEDINIDVIGNDLIIKGERKSESCSKARDYIQCEIAYGNFYRSLPLPSEVRKSGIKASYSDGILQVDLPKDHSKKSKRVGVKISAARPKAKK